MPGHREHPLDRPLNAMVGWQPPTRFEWERLIASARKAVSSLGDPYHERAIQLLQAVVENPFAPPDKHWLED